jgi:Tol biopolymer transport system component
MNADGSNPHIVTTTTDTFDVEPKFSPDGKQVMFVRIRRDVITDDGLQPEAVFIMNSDGSSLHQLTPWGPAEHPNWSPDGLWVAFDENTFFPGQYHPRVLSSIFRLHPGGGNLQIVLNGTNRQDVRKPTFSPDGKSLLLTLGGDIQLMNLKSSEVTNVTRTPQFFETNASWGVKASETH